MQRQRRYYKDIPYCPKCETTYETMAEGFYWKEGRGWARPCRNCTKAYNKTPAQKKVRNAANRRYGQTPKGKVAIERSKRNRAIRNGWRVNGTYPGGS